MLEHCIPTNPKDDETIIEAELIMQHKDDLLEDLGYALEELQRASMFLEILRHLLDVGDSHRDQTDQARWAALLIQQSLLVNESAVDCLQVWPKRLYPQESPL